MMTAGVLTDRVSTFGRANPWLKRAALLAIGVALMWISAKIKVATIPVPVTMQTLVVVAIGMAYGARMGAATMIAYLALGAAGQPVFAGTPELGIGLPYMLGSTGGYLAGFVLAAGATGWLAERGWDRNILTATAAMAVGMVALFLPGALWLAYGFPLTAFGASFAGIGFEKAIEFGVAPFVWIDAMKLALAAVGFPLIWKLIGGRI
ncbi:MAG: biotin transporter BioY [Pikeienuella sp.]